MQVLLVSMPFGAIDRPALGISLLKAALIAKGVDCAIGYLNCAFAEQIGAEAYDWVTNQLPYTAFAGDWCFTHALYGPRPAADYHYIDSVLRGLWRLDDAAITNLVAISRLTPAFIDMCCAAHDWRHIDIVGFTSTFTQNIASLALARQLKSRFPHLKIVFGGANWEGEMGEELHRQFGFVDFVCQGEADESFPSLVDHVLSGNQTEPPASGIVYRRRDGSTAVTARATPVTDMNALPVPDFTEFFARLSASASLSSIRPILLMEMSRGCWWGAKSHCTFCGLNGNSMAFRSKNAARALSELDHLANRWKAPFVSIVDNILDMSYFNTLLPALSKLDRKPRLFFEVKANLKRTHLKTLAAAGVCSIQPGIENLSDRILKLMRKGTTGLRNIQLLKWCSEYGIKPEWNVLYGFPGETASDYHAVLKILPAINHLEPPSGCGPVRLDRFSPYFMNPESFGLRNLRPIAPFRFLYPFGPDSLRRIAYYFDFDYDVTLDPTGAAASVVEFAEAWAKQPGRRKLTATDNGERLILTEIMAGASPQRHVLTSFDRAVYLMCDEVHSLEVILEELHQLFPENRFSLQSVQNLLNSLVANRLMIFDGRHYLAIAVYKGFPESWRERLAHPLQETHLQYRTNDALEVGA